MTTPPDVAPIGDEALRQADRLLWDLIARYCQLKGPSSEQRQCSLEISGLIPALIARIRAAEARQQVPEGWKLVPEVATSEMLDAGTEHSRDPVAQAEMLDRWEWMLNAAPPPPAVGCRLRATEARQQQWRPISEAPRDGTDVWVYAPAYDGLAAIQCRCAWHQDAGWCVDELRQVSHYMPLPPPPEAGA